MSFVQSNVDTRTVTLAFVLHTHRSKTPLTASAGFDKGNTYYEVLCSQCQTILGKSYIATTPELDELRNLFTLDTDALSSYQVGTQQPMNDWALDGATKVLEYEKNVQMIEQLHGDMGKVQNLLLVIDERLCDTERQLETFKRGAKRPPTNGDSAVSGGGSNRSSPGVTTPAKRAK
ncbi:hypothetical protein SPRG_11835 [Saprolegnia parasitica CBS 223.65]|uniref:Mis18 domain-containing protein n=1 Tax=Saprolegnia parasitica (strain CBS 223.65) TaxID=695850 RepID=A0A067BXH2_SAPPC|nr:hypothetical protein SPRG_11835 [Saprolegnia parasitica CBS 223.65]KDO22988.1 hypothetical protein SPRG_11835 [Saprolegnia parasitica CBS 223.65]|eukprot:XP_012206279.1 hypothetical protein SPRG_11835 [Saprolegnia parasitica CBS 223.65]